MVMVFIFLLRKGCLEEADFLSQKFFIKMPKEIRDNLLDSETKLVLRKNLSQKNNL